MAFVYRAERDFTIKKDEDGVGPGQYVGHSEIKKKLGYAPFLSITERITLPIQDPTVAVPGKDSLGPGRYTPMIGFDAVKQNMECMRSIQEQGLNNFGIRVIHPSP